VTILYIYIYIIFEQTAAETGGAAPEEAPKKKGGKKSAEPRVVIAKIQRQKRKFVTAIAGLESVPGE
jgi:translation initiation factor 1 (eIF-1/SUI1)